MTQRDCNFYSGVNRLCDKLSQRTVEKVWKAVAEYIVRAIYNTNTCYVPYLGTFNVRKIEESIQHQKTPSGRIVEYIVPARIVPVFIPENPFIDDVNGHGVTKEYRKRLKNNALTARDYERLMRTEQIESPDVYQRSEDDLERARDDFKKMLDAKVQREAQKRQNKISKEN